MYPKPPCSSNYDIHRGPTGLSRHAFRVLEYTTKLPAAFEVDLSAPLTQAWGNEHKIDMAGTILTALKVRFGVEELLDWRTETGPQRPPALTTLWKTNMEPERAL